MQMRSRATNLSFFVVKFLFARGSRTEVDNIDQKTSVAKKSNMVRVISYVSSVIEAPMLTLVCAQGSHIGSISSHIIAIHRAEGGAVAAPPPAAFQLLSRPLCRPLCSCSGYGDRPDFSGVPEMGSLGNSDRDQLAYNWFGCWRHLEGLLSSILQGESTRHVLRCGGRYRWT